MAEMKDPRGKRPTPRKQDPLFSHSPDADMAPNQGTPAVLHRPAAKSKKKSWFQQNQMLVIGSAVGVGVLVILLVLGLAFGMFGGGSPAKPSVAPLPTPVAGQPAPPPPAPPPSQSAASQPTPPQPTPTQPAPAQPIAAQGVPGPPSAGGGFSSGGHHGSAGQPVSPGQPSPGQAPAPNGDKGEAKKDQKPLVPDDVAKWKPADYKIARRSNHPKLLEAIIRLGEKYRGNEKAAQCLVDLLKPLPPEKAGAASPAGTPSAPATPPGPQLTPRGNMPPRVGGSPGAPPAYGPPPNPNPDGSHPYNPADLTKLVETIIEALGCNGSGLAESTLEQVLAGTFATDDDKVAVEATLKTLLVHPSEQGDALLLRAVTAAKDLRSSEHEGPWPARDLETKAFEMVKQSGSLGLRTKLAGAALSKHARFDQKDPTTEFLLLSNPLNCGAQVLFYERPDVKKNKELKTTLEQQFLAYSSEAVARCLGITVENLPAAPGAPSPVTPRGGGFSGAGARPGGRGGFSGGPTPVPMGGGPPRPSEPLKAVDSDLGAQIAGQLWSDQFRKLIEPQLNELHSLEKQPELMVLAATIPADSTRSILAKLLHKHWSDGPKALETAGLTDRAITDPGLLPIIKVSGKRKESPSTPKVMDTSRHGGRGPVSATPPGGVQKKQQAEQDWMDVSAKLVSGWCKRLGGTESAKDASDESDKSSGDAAKANLPSGFKLPPAAEVVASRHVTLPGAAPAGFSQAQPSSLDVYYVRARESAKPKKAIDYYCRQALARQNDARTYDGKTWIEPSRTALQKDRLRSVDVLITGPGGTPALVVPEKGKERAVAEDEVDLTVEILIIEIKDPNKEPAKDVARASARESK
ncbi:MAG: hypothetical protein WCB27_12565 [Thermoguttaceae bacterium]